VNIAELHATYSAARARLWNPPRLILDVNARETIKAEQARREQAEHKYREHFARIEADRIARKKDAVIDLYRQVPIDGQGINDHIAGDRVDQIKIASREIIRAVSTVYNISRDDLFSPRRTAEIVWPRQVAMWAMKKTTKMSLPQIGRRFAGRDHTTVLHAVKKIQTLVEAGKIDPLPSLISAVLRHRAEVRENVPFGEDAGQ
jgi:chromosomal replication initiation ATPase DnaA